MPPAARASFFSASLETTVFCPCRKHTHKTSLELNLAAKPVAIKLQSNESIRRVVPGTEGEFSCHAARASGQWYRSLASVACGMKRSLAHENDCAVSRSHVRSIFGTVSHGSTYDTRQGACEGTTSFDRHQALPCALRCSS